MSVVTHSLNPLALLEEVRDERLKILSELDDIKAEMKRMDNKVKKEGLMLSDAGKASLRLRLDINKAMAQVVNQKIQTLGTLVELKMLLDEIQKELKSLQDAINTNRVIKSAKEGHLEDKAVVAKVEETGEVKVFKQQGRPKGSKDKKPRKRRPNNG